MSKTIHTKENQSQTSFEDQASKNNVFFSESLSGVIDENLSGISDESVDSIGDQILSIGSDQFSVFPLKIEKIDGSIFLDLKIHNFDISYFIKFDSARINIIEQEINCKLISYCCPTEKTEYGLIRILLSERT